MNFAVLWLFVKAFSAKFRGHGIHWHGKREQSVNRLLISNKVYNVLSMVSDLPTVYEHWCKKMKK